MLQTQHDRHSELKHHDSLGIRYVASCQHVGISRGSGIQDSQVLEISELEGVEPVLGNLRRISGFDTKTS